MLKDSPSQIKRDGGLNVAYGLPVARLCYIVYILLFIINCSIYLYSQLCIENKVIGNSSRLKKDTDDNQKSEETQKITLENYFRNKAKDYSHRYYGHCNTSTDIKEANFFGR